MPGGIRDSNDHLHTNLPILVLGGGGRHLRVPENTPLANLHLTLLDKLDVPIETFAAATAPDSSREEARFGPEQK